MSTFFSPNAGYAAFYSGSRGLRTGAVGQVAAVGVRRADTVYVLSRAAGACCSTLMSDMSKLPPVDARLLIAFLAIALIVFAIGRVVAARFL